MVPSDHRQRLHHRSGADHRHRTTIGRAQRLHHRTDHRHEQVTYTPLALWLTLLAFLVSAGETTAAMVVLLVPLTIGLLVTIGVALLTPEGGGDTARR